MKKINDAVLNQVTTHALRAAICVIGGIVLALCIFVLPPMWRAVADGYPNHTYVFYGILSALYAAAVPFFIALWQALKLLGYIDKSSAFSSLSVQALKTISYCGMAIGTVFTAVMPLIYVWANNDDAPGLILFWSLLVGASLTVSVFAGVMERVLKQAIQLKNENDLTV